jgi:hypothetical protein
MMTWQVSKLCMPFKTSTIPQGGKIRQKLSLFVCARIEHLWMSPRYKQKVISILQGLKKSNINEMRRKDCLEANFQLTSHWDRKFGHRIFANDPYRFLKKCFRVFDEIDSFNLFVLKDICKVLSKDSLGMFYYTKLCKLEHQWVDSTDFLIMVNFI